MRGSKTIEDGIHTYDIYKEGVSSEKVGTKEFAEAVVERMGQKPETLKPVEYKKAEEVEETEKKPIYTIREPQKKELVGVDVFLHWWNGNYYGSGNDLGPKLEEAANGDGVKLVMISNRGTKVYPKGFEDTFCVDHWRCRFMAENQGDTITHQQVLDLLKRTMDGGFDFIKTEHLYTFDGEPGFSLGQGQ